MSESLAYFGGKSGSGTYQTIINQIPPHRVYVELFGGMLGIYRHKRPAQYNLVIEKDTDLFATYQERFNLRKINNDPQWAQQRMESKKGKGHHCYNGCAFDFMEIEYMFLLMNMEDTFIYADPPYPQHTRSSSTRYKNEMTDEDHVRLLDYLTGFNTAKVAISTYPNDIYYEYFEGRDQWRFIEFESQTRHGKAIEQLWMNYPEPVELHDYQHLGKDYRERERISRKLNRWEAKFRDLAPLEQAAMIQRLTSIPDPIAVARDDVAKALLFKYQNSFESRWKDESTHKIYPFYIHQCLSIDPQDPFDLICETCGDSEEGNSVVKCANFVFFDKDTVKSYCCKKCMPGEIISYENQVYGFPTPAQFPEHLKDSMMHVVVWDQVGEHTRYKLQGFLNKKFTVEMLKKDRQLEYAFFPEWHGSHGRDRSWENKHGNISVLEYNGVSAYKEPSPSGEVNDTRHLKTKKGKTKSLLEISPGMIAEAMTDIMSTSFQKQVFNLAAPAVLTV